MSRIAAWLLVCFAIGGAPAAARAAEIVRECAGPQFRGSADHRAVYCGDPVRRVAGAIWKFATGGPVESSPSVAGDFVYFGSGDGRLYAANALATRRGVPPNADDDVEDARL